MVSGLALKSILLLLDDFDITKCKLVSNNGSLYFVSFNIDNQSGIVISFTLPLTITGTIIVDFTHLLALLKKLKTDDEFTVTVTDSHISFTSLTATVSCPILQDVDVYSFPVRDIKDAVDVITTSLTPSDKFVKYLNLAKKPLDKKCSIKVLSNVYLNRGEIVSSDGERLFVGKVEDISNFQLLIPAEIYETFIYIVSASQSITVTEYPDLYFIDGNLGGLNLSYRFFFNKSEYTVEQFPNYNAVIPTEFVSEYEFKKTEIASIIGSLRDLKVDLISLQIKEGTFIFGGNNVENFSQSIKCLNEVEAHNPVEYYFEFKNFYDMVQTFTKGNIIFKANVKGLFATNKDNDLMVYTARVRKRH